MAQNSVFVIAECGSNWRFGPSHLNNAFRMIVAAKECGADAAKFQWTSDGHAMAKRRGLTHDNYRAAGDMYEEYVKFDEGWLSLLKEKCDEVGIEFMCTVYLPQDVAVIAPFVKRFKVAAMESCDRELKYVVMHGGREVIVSIRHENAYARCYSDSNVSFLHCVSKYPCQLEEIEISQLNLNIVDGLSDHTAHVLTGAVAVGAGAKIIESHVRLHDTPSECPDYGHSLPLDEIACTLTSQWNCDGHHCYGQYVQNIRTAEKMVG